MVTGYLTTVLPLLGDGILIVLGLLGSLRPDDAADIVGITPNEPLGRAEVRATYGGIFLERVLPALSFGLQKRSS